KFLIKIQRFYLRVFSAEHTLTLNNRSPKRQCALLERALSGLNWTERGSNPPRSAKGRQADFDAAVLRAALGIGVRGDRLRRSHADDREAARVGALPRQIVGNSTRSALRQLHIVIVAARRIRMAIDVDQSLVEALDDQSDRIQGAVECRLDARRIGREGDVGRHVQDDLVTLARYAHARPLELATQFGFLAVHIGTDGTAGESAHAGTEQRVAAIVTAGEKAEPGSRQCAERRAAGRIGDLLDRKST